MLHFATGGRKKHQLILSAAISTGYISSAGELERERGKHEPLYGAQRPEAGLARGNWSTERALASSERPKQLTRLVTLLLSDFPQVVAAVAAVVGLCQVAPPAKLLSANTNDWLDSVDEN